ncbi:autotransporter-associated beta strand repeat-containing protein [Bradyrhizobium lablabi]|uniref:Autotransporter-associated beta strand repeat-containing protein n=1 Tax=Bradyrhizobium lablabi TaxID=722472 RepID=A0A1M7AAX1_9BRAD|nr:autotransporter outer membrane beta-barrel domain-containing protein [Bradyrhizobium lablabi]SHL39881.1 autotransporter-associated beta strand repeat-containing protein [Bradyrhizobium lablabi]
MKKLLLGATVMFAVVAAMTLPAAAQDATWLASPVSNDFDAAANWNPATVPTGTAFFGVSTKTALAFTAATTVGGWTFNAGASAYTFNSALDLNFTGAGIVVNGGSAAITHVGNTLSFANSSTAGSATVTNSGAGKLSFTNNSTAGRATITNTAINGNLSFADNSTAGTATITNDNTGNLSFAGNSTAGSATIININTSNLSFANSSTAGSATITNNNSGRLTFKDSSTASSATITNDGIVQFFNTSTAGSATIANNHNGQLLFQNSSTAGTATITNNNTLTFINSSTAGSATITNTNNNLLLFANNSTAGNATIANNNGSQLIFQNSSTAGSATITNNASSTLIFFDTSTAGSATITNNNALTFDNNSTAGSATITNNNTLIFNNSSTAGSAAIANSGSVQFFNTSTAGGATITNGSGLFFHDTSTAGSATITTGGATAFFNSSSGGSARFITEAGGFFDISGLVTGGTTAGSIEGAGHYDLGGNSLAVGSNNLSTEVSGVISDAGDSGGSGGSLVKVGTGTLTLSGLNAYTGATTVNGGTLEVDGSIATSSLASVNAGGTLSGTGSVGATQINAGGTLAPGSTANPTGTFAIAGNLAFQSGSLYLVHLNPAAAARTNVSGTATLTGASVQTVFAPGSYLTKSFDILHATGGLGGTTFAGVSGNVPAGIAESLSYTATDVFLNLSLTNLGAGGGLNQNQQNVANAINTFFNKGGALPPGFVSLFGLSGGNLNNALTQVSGETATGSQQATFDAMGMFIGVMTDPFMAGRGDAVSSPSGASGFAEENDSAGADGSSDKSLSKNERDAYGMMLTKAPLAQSYDPRWSVWGAGFGGSQTTDGNAAIGSNSATSRIAGTAVGADYRFSPFTIAGFALAGGGTNFSVANGGTGRSDLFQAGAFVKHTVGQAYISGALAYGWQDITTNRTVTVAGLDQLQARFNANAYSGRLEGGYRFVSPWIGGVGLTPYAAGQFTTFDLPAYAEHAIMGSNQFGLAYGSKSVTDSRSELGLRSDKSFAMPNAILTLRGRFAWAHDFNPDRAIAATFQALPGASFVVNGAAQAHDSALTTASAEIKWLNGWSAAATFEGEFSDVTRSYAGKGVVRYAW